MTLEVALCSSTAAKYAVTHWHYSHSMPGGPKVYVGAWENGRFIGAVIFSNGVTNSLLRPWGLNDREGCELVRVALDRHTAPVSQIVAAALKLLKRTNPGLRLVVSFADPQQGHHGGIYQAGGWLYTGTTIPGTELVVKGRRVHARTVGARYGTSSVAWLRANVDANAHTITTPGKHRYLMPLDKPTRRRLLTYAQPYPPRGGSVGGDTHPSQGEGEVRPLDTALSNT